MAMPVTQGRQTVQAQILAQERAGQGVAVAGGHVGAAAVPNQAGQRQAAADFQHALSDHHRVQGHALGQPCARGPQQTKQGPHGRGNAQAEGGAIRVVKLLFVQQGADPQVGRP